MEAPAESYSQFALKHSWPQKKDPGIPNLSGKSEKKVSPAAKSANLWQVGHSSLEAGYPLIQGLLVHLIT